MISSLSIVILTGDTPIQQAALVAAVGVSAPHDHTLVIKLNAPQVTILDCMALQKTYIQ
jgi:ABC-type oligopeptide transport system substrate-binding subunit